MTRTNETVHLTVDVKKERNMKIKKPRYRYFHDELCDYVLNWIVVDTKKRDRYFIDDCKARNLDWENDVRSYVDVATFADEERAEEYCNMLNGKS